ncbi:MAG: hypothetical protein U0K53_01640 [Paludibacteraceae bacterium]|nr:hypothetical protein [Paludibacteraceae bacterium]
MKKIEETETSIAYLSLKAKMLLKQQGCNASLLGRYIEDFGLCFIVDEHWSKRRLIHASVFFDLAEENMLTMDNIKRNSI